MDRKILHIILFLLSFIVPTMAEQQGLTVVTGSRIGGTEERTRFVVDIAGDLQYSVQTLADPDRVTILLKETDFQLPPGVGKKSRGLISEMRYGAAENGQSKIVLLTKRPAKVENTFLIPGTSGNPARLVLDIVASARNGLGGVAEQPLIQAQSFSAVDTSVKKRVVVIDPGHGGADPGAVSLNGVTEKSVVLSFAKTLRAALEKTGRYQVVLTRENDEFVKLKDRVNIARANKAELFLALHADTVRTKSTRGATFYTLSEEASDAEAADLAHKENRADIIAGVELPTENNQVADILIELAQRESISLAVDFSKKAVGVMDGVVLMTGKPMRSAGFTVLRAPDVPSVLVELGYLSNTKDEKLLQQEDWHMTFAQTLTAAIDKHFEHDDSLREPVALDGDADAAAASP
jgi:N-acetylmuramoyl-L-alanine amidase